MFFNKYPQHIDTEHTGTAESIRSELPPRLKPVRYRNGVGSGPIGMKRRQKRHMRGLLQL